MRDRRAPLDQIAAEIAADRHGVLRTDLLRAIGFDKRAVHRRVRAGRLHPKYRNVYAWGHPGLSVEGEWLAAVDACHPHSYLSHLAAASVHKLIRWEDDWLIDVTVADRSGRRPKAGIRIHHPRAFSPSDGIEREAIPTTNVPRTLSDLARAASPVIYRAALREAEFRGHRKGLPAGYIPTRSEFEHEMVGFCDRHGLPQPRTRISIGGHEADFLFEDEGLFMETDGWDAHRGSVAFQSDHERDLWMKAEGLEFVRITWDQMTRQGDDTAAKLRRILERLRRRPGR